MSSGSSPISWLAMAAPSFTMANPSMKRGYSHKRNLLMAKFSRPRMVCTPYNTFSGTSTLPSRSLSVRVFKTSFSIIVTILQFIFSFGFQIIRLTLRKVTIYFRIKKGFATKIVRMTANRALAKGAETGRARPPCAPALRPGGCAGRRYSGAESPRRRGRTSCRS